MFMRVRTWRRRPGGMNPMGENQNRPFHFSFNSSLKVDFQGSRVTSDAGLLVVRELDERLGLSELISDNLTDARRGRNTQLPLPDPAPTHALPASSSAIPKSGRGP